MIPPSPSVSPSREERKEKKRGGKKERNVAGSTLLLASYSPNSIWRSEREKKKEKNKGESGSKAVGASPIAWPFLSNFPITLERKEGGAGDDTQHSHKRATPLLTTMRLGHDRGPQPPKKKSRGRGESGGHPRLFFSQFVGGGRKEKEEKREGISSAIPFPSPPPAPKKTLQATKRKEEKRRG